MKSNRAALALAILAVAIALWSSWKTGALQSRVDSFSTPQPSAPIPAPSLAPTNLAQRLLKLETAMPDAGLIMLGIQSHFSKLYFAAEARNWDLARFERLEIEEDLTTVAALHPEEKGVNLAGVIGAFKETQLAALKDAIEVSDHPLFRKAYQDCIVMCNACHQSTGRPFIVITVPTNPPVFNQQWEPPR